MEGCTREGKEMEWKGSLALLLLVKGLKPKIEKFDFFPYRLWRAIEGHALCVRFTVSLLKKLFLFICSYFLNN